MKNIVLIIGCLWSCTSLLAQNNEGVITYEHKVDIHRSLPDDMSGFKDRIPRYRETKHKLYFNAEESYYERYKDSTEIAKGRERGRRGGRGFRMMAGGGRSGEKIYTDLATGDVLAERHFFGKDFLVKGEAEQRAWKMTGEQMEVGSYLCMKATYQDSTDQIVAWFTPMVPVSSGPADYTDLPGMVLHVDINDGERTITALDIDLGTLSDDVIQKPSKGKAMTQEEYMEMVEEKVKEMETEFGGKGQRPRRFMRRGGRE